LTPRSLLRRYSGYLILRGLVLVLFLPASLWIS
jgi:hypothetical protein